MPMTKKTMNSLECGSVAITHYLSPGLIPEEDIKDSEKGNIIAGMMLLFIILLSIISATCLYQSYWRFGVVQLDSKVYVSFSDLLLIFQMIGESF